MTVKTTVGFSIADTPVAYFDNFEINNGFSVGAVDPAGKLSGTWGRIKARL
jgi:hypothetical protein